MATWASFEAAAPRLAATGRQFFYMYGVGMGFLATVRGDGGPRVHPICPIITDDALFALIIPGPKLEVRWPGFESQVLFELEIERCLLTLTEAAYGLPTGHSIWRADDPT